MKTAIFTAALFASSLLGSQAAVTIQSYGGWFESGFVTWTPIEGATDYHVYYRASSTEDYTKLDASLVRRYADYSRADVLGIPAGEYTLKVVPVNASGEITDEATETKSFSVTAYDRGGYAHFATSSSTFKVSEGIGAYRNDGTLKKGAKVFYVHAGNASKITTDVITDTKGGTTTAVGMQHIIDLYAKGLDKTPLDFRIIGTIKASDMDALSSSAEGLQVKGKNAYSELNITIEGVGQDAAIHGFGILFRNACSVELRNLGMMWAMDDAVSIDTDNCNIWVHNLDLFYGKPGSDSDQKKGDGTLDIKGDSRYTTFSFNHLWDSGKASLCGMTSESGPNYLTYHHNWFDHSDSRHPRIRTMSVHVYNNYFDGNSKYGVGATMGSDVFVEANYFRNCKYPMLTSLQGSDVNNGVGTKEQTKGTFSGEAGGSIKAWNNYMTGHKAFAPYQADDATYSVHFDAYVASTRNEQVPASVVSLSGANTYSNFDTDPSLIYSDYHCDDASDVPGIVTGSLGAGRCQKGDFQWTFSETDDSDDQVITELSSAIQNYQSSLLGFYSESELENKGDQKEEDDDKKENEEETPFSGLELCHFTGKKPSSNMVSVSGNYSDSKGSFAYDDSTYAICVKMESSTAITIKPTTDCTITLYFGGTTSAAGKKIKLDDVSIMLTQQGTYAFAGEAGETYTLKKGDSINLFLISFQAKDNSNGIDELASLKPSVRSKALRDSQIVVTRAQRTYDLNGRKK